MRWRPIILSRKQIKAADRVGGAKLILPWPPGLPDGNRGRPLKVDEERDANTAERAAADQIVGPACQKAGLVPVRVIAERVRLPRGETAQRLSVIIIGRRWVHASTGRIPTGCWYDGPIELL